MKYLKASFTFLLKMPVYFYKYCLSPLLPHSCRYYPTCSSYTLLAINEFGLKGVFIALKRIFRCSPLSKKCGYDPVPINIKGDTKWLF